MAKEAPSDIDRTQTAHNYMSHSLETTLSSPLCFRIISVQLSFVFYQMTNNFKKATVPPLTSHDGLMNFLELTCTQHTQCIWSGRVRASACSSKNSNFLFQIICWQEIEMKAFLFVHFRKTQLSLIAFQRNSVACN